MAIDVGTVAEGKITGITRYGAFVTLADNTVGMYIFLKFHISLSMTFTTF